MAEGGANVQKQPTIRDVAHAAGVSVAVVSRVLNPGSGPVAPLTRSGAPEWGARRSLCVAPNLSERVC